MFRRRRRPGIRTWRRAPKSRPASGPPQTIEPLPAGPALRLALTLALASLVACAEAPLRLPTASSDAAPAAAAQFRYRVDVEAPAPLRAALSAQVDLVRWSDYTDMTADLFERLVREAPGQARASLEALGHFDPRIDVAVDRAADPVAVKLAVEPGEPVRIRSVRIEVTGPAQRDEPPGGDAIRRLQGEWLLGRGATFTQERWDEAKDRAVATLRASPYAAARIATSEARIHPDERAADLAVTLESGPAFRFGAVAIEGLQRYSESLVRNFDTIVPGSPYMRAELDQYVRRLNASGYFASVHANLDADPESAGAAKVTVGVIEAPPRSLEAGLGYSTDTGFSAKASYSDVDLDRGGLQLHADGRLDQKVQSAALRFVRPPTPAGWLHSIAAQAERTDIENLVTQTASVTLRRDSLDERNRTSWIGAYYFDHQQPSGADDTSAHALYLALVRTWRNVDDLVAPQRGYVLNAELGGGVPGVSSRGFGRAIVRYASWHPVGRASALDLRAEAGAVLAGSRSGVPSALLFRTGGDTTVRGYAFQSLGVKDGDAVVGGRYYAVASAELLRWVTEQWGVAAFVDAGNAADAVRDLAPVAVGYGLGARFRTPIGPFRADLAYGQRDHSVRLHLSVGLSF